MERGLKSEENVDPPLRVSPEPIAMQATQKLWYSIGDLRLGVSSPWVLDRMRDMRTCHISKVEGSSGEVLAQYKPQ